MVFLETKEFKRLEIDVDKGIYELNDKDLKGCQEVSITIKPESAEVFALITGDTIYSTLEKKR